MVESSIQLAHLVAAGRVDADVLAWLRDGLARHLAGEPLEQSLGLDRASRLRARDRALLRAADALGPSPSTWATAGRLAAALRRFDTRVRPRLKPDDELPPLDEALRAAFACGERVPATQRALYALLV